MTAYAICIQPSSIQPTARPTVLGIIASLLKGKQGGQDEIRLAKIHLKVE